MTLVPEETPAVTLVILLAAAVTMFGVGMSALSLPSLDDCFYARKAVEMARSGALFRVTWAGEPTFQNPPLHFWIVGRSVAVFGESDFAARLPSVVMAAGILALTYRIGVRLLNPASGLTAVALLLVTPTFVDNARRVMMEIPVTFWITAAMWSFLKGGKHPLFDLLSGFAVGAAVLTKSVLGFLPLLVIAPLLGFARGGGEVGRRRSLWLGGAIALLVAGSWTAYLWWGFGPEAIRAHYGSEIAARAMTGFNPVSAATAYLVILLVDFQPVVIPGLIGAGRLLGPAWRRRDEGQLLLVSWIGLPLILYGLAGARSERYIFPILPALALAGGHWLVQIKASLAMSLRRYVAPLVALTVAAVFQVAPSWLTRDLNGVFKAQASVFRESLATDEKLTYAGDAYWEVANPLLYYADRLLETPTADLHQAIRLARQSRSQLLLVDRNRRSELEQTGEAHEIRLEGSRWLLVSVAPNR